jgi:hypothetical protein
MLFMKKLILFLFIISFCLPETTFASENTQNQSFDKGKNGRYRVKKHRLKKFFMGKRYCDCPKH